MAFSITVLRISLTSSRALRMPGTKPQAAPARKPTIMVEGMSSHPGQAANVSGNHVAMSAPAMICPSPPMLMTLARNAMQMPSPTSRSGVAFTRVCVRPNRDPDHAVDQRRVSRKRVGPQDDQHHGPEQEGEDHADKGQEDVQDDPAPVDAEGESNARAVDSRLWSQKSFLRAYLYHTPTPADRKIS